MTPVSVHKKRKFAMTPSATLRSEKSASLNRPNGFSQRRVSISSTVTDGLIRCSSIQALTRSRFLRRATIICRTTGYRDQRDEQKGLAPGSHCYYGPDEQRAHELADGEAGVMGADREPPILLLPPLSHHRHVYRLHRTRAYAHQDPKGPELIQGVGYRGPNGSDHHHGHGCGPHPRSAGSFSKAVSQRS